jgi:CMP-N,N'-diacetyllegionaminic acid synthase
MIRGLPVSVIIPVRGGSKGIPGKNLYRMGRDSLLVRAIKIAKLCNYVDQVLVSTDDQNMFEISQSYSVALNSLRPKELATDDAKTVDVVLDAIQKASISTGWILLMQVTSPLRTLEDLNDFCKAFHQGLLDANSAVSLVSFDSPHPDKIQKIEDGIVKSYLGKESMVPRQSLPEVFALNGAFYLVDVETLVRERRFITEKTVPFVMSKEKSINLDTMEDIHYLEMMLEKKHINIEEYE